MRRPFFLISLFIILFAGLSFAGWPGIREDLSRDFNRLFEVAQLLRSEYVDEVSNQRLLAGALNGMLKSLDPYSQFLDAEAFRELKAETQGEFGGIGIEVGVRNGHLQVIAPLDESPAEKAGLLGGDAIIKIDDVPTHDMSLSESTRRMRGQPGTSVRLNVLREKENRVFDVEVRREVIRVKSVKDVRLLDGGVGYVRIAFFQDNTSEDLEKSVKWLLSQGAESIILDLRNNSGGLFHEAVDAAALFIPKGDTVVSTRSRNPKKTQTFYSESGALSAIKKMAVLINKGSASGSEILAGALQDTQKGIVIGAKSFGKGSVQTLTSLADGTAVRMTTSRYYTPKGRVIHEIGIEPDILVEGEKGDASDPALERAAAFLRA